MPRFQPLEFSFIRSTFFAAVLYFLLCIFLTWPLILNFGSLLFGDYGDTRGVVWGIWAKNNGYLESQINNLVAAPFGKSTASGFSTPISELIVLMLAKISNEIVAYNLYTFLAFPLTGISTYLLLNRLLGNGVPCFIGGFIFAFSPAAVMQAVGGHAAFAFNVFIPVLLLGLLYNQIHHKLLSAFYVSTCLMLITFTALYFGYFAIYIIAYFMLFDFLSNKNGNFRLLVINYFCVVVFAACLILPFTYLAIYQQIVEKNDVLAKSGQIRDIVELFIFSSRPWEFLIPSIDHPIMGVHFEDFMRSNLHSSNIPEQTLYLGLVPLGLIAAGIIFLWRNKFNPSLRIYFLFFSFGALWMFFLTLPPMISFGKIDVPTVSYFAYQIAPMFRVYSRFGILVNFFIAGAVAVVLTHLYQNISRIRYFLTLLVLLPLLLFEYWSIPPNHAQAVNSSPEIYKWLMQEPGDFLVAEYPMMRFDDASFYSYLFWQRIHKKRLVNGASPDNENAWEFFQKVKDLDNPETSTLLKSIGVKYVLVHSKVYQDGIIPKSLKRYFPESLSNSSYNDGSVPPIPFNLKLEKTFGSDMVFSLDAIGSVNPRHEELLLHKVLK